MERPSTPADHNGLTALLVMPLVLDVGLLVQIGSALPFCSLKPITSPPHFGEFVKAPLIPPSRSPSHVVGMIPPVHRSTMFAFKPYEPLYASRPFICRVSHVCPSMSPL
jgi:hypothetical protein